MRDPAGPHGTGAPHSNQDGPAPGMARSTRDALDRRTGEQLQRGDPDHVSQAGRVELRREESQGHSPEGNSGLNAWTTSPSAPEPAPWDQI